MQQLNKYLIWFMLCFAIGFLFVDLAKAAEVIKDRVLIYGTTAEKPTLYIPHEYCPECTKFNWRLFRYGDPPTAEMMGHVTPDDTKIVVCGESKLVVSVDIPRTGFYYFSVNACKADDNGDDLCSEWVDTLDPAVGNYDCEATAIWIYGGPEAPGQPVFSQ